MIYRVVVDRYEMYTDNDDIALISPSLTIELNAAGSLEFTLPPEHNYYDVPRILNSNVEVYEEDEMIWYGRPTEISIDFYNQKRIYCEGALSYLNDTIIKKKKYTGTGVRTVLNDIIDNHNSLVDEDRRKFEVGNVTVDDESLIKDISYEKSLDVLNSLIEDYGGYLFVNKVNGKNTIDWLKELPEGYSQPIVFGLNLEEMTQKTVASEFATSIIPYGRLNNDDVTVSSVNNGLDYIDSDAVSEYGRIMQAVDFGDVTSIRALYNLGVHWLEENQFDMLSIDIDAAELHYIVSKNRCFNNAVVVSGEDTGITLADKFPAFKVGQTIHCTSYPHLVDRDFPLTKITIELDNAAKKITMGSSKERYISSRK